MFWSFFIINGLCVNFVLNDIICYSCISLNQRQVNEKDKKPSYKLSSTDMRELNHVMSRSGLKIPEYSETCSDAPLSVQPIFSETPIAVCRKSNDLEPECAKLSFSFRDERVVVRQCMNKRLKTKKIHNTLEISCQSGLVLKSLFHLKNVSVCGCSKSLCNTSSVLYGTPVITLIAYMFLKC
ncbi:unnamed protein product [Auanema sp. JU1783]|nr:unnamed protein product [Auanema sp. JU1783]